MLNARLYRISWLIAGAALIVALLTLRPASSVAPDPALPSAFDGRAALALTGELALRAPERPPGSEGNVVAADWVERKLAALPGGRARVGRQEFVVRSNGQSFHLRNVYLAVPADPASKLPSTILVVAPRDTPVGVAGGTSGTAVMLELARLASVTARQHPMLFVSTDGSTLGNAGVRWFIDRFSGTSFAGAIVLDAPGEASGTRVRIWSMGRARGRALALQRMAEGAVQRAGGRPDGHVRLLTQVMRLAVPQTFGDQGPLIAAGVPAVTLAGRPDAPLRGGDKPTLSRMSVVGDAAETLIGSIDAGDRVRGPQTAVTLMGKVLWPGAARVLLLLLALPLLVCGFDALARLRRARVPLLPGLRALAWRAAPAIAALLAAQLLVVLGALPGSAAGAPPLPEAVGFDSLAGLSLALVALAGLGAWSVAKRRRLRLGATPSGEAVAALIAMAAVVLGLWWLHPYTLALVLPAAHAGLLATAAPRRWHLYALGGVALLPLAALALLVGAQLDRNPGFATWYLLETAVSGARSMPGAISAILVATCAWGLARFVVFRVKKGLIPGRPAPARSAREQAAPAQPARG